MPDLPKIEDPEAFYTEFVTAYLRAGLARMPKRDLDILVLRLLDRYTDLGELGPWEIARRHGSTPTRVKNLRTEGQYLYPERGDPYASVKRALYRSLTVQDVPPLDGQGRLVLVMPERFARDCIVELGAREGFHARYERGRVLLSPEAFRRVCAILLQPDEFEQVIEIAKVEQRLPAESRWEEIRRKFVGPDRRPKLEGIADLFLMLAKQDASAAVRLLTAS